ncbi:MAG: LiaF domain-containing protein [Bacillota bacterium]
MRVGNLFGGTLLGIILILIGLSALLRSFDINIPFGRIIIGILIIYVGIVILFGGSVINTDENIVMFGESNIRVGDFIEDEYNVIFGRGVIDLRDVNLENLDNRIEINTIFGSSEVLLDSSKPIRIDASSVFGQVRLPNGNSVSFGDLKYNNITDETNKTIYLKSSVVFGESKIRFVK